MFHLCVCAANILGYVHLSSQRSVVPGMASQILSAQLQLLFKLLLQNVHLFPTTKHLENIIKIISAYPLLYKVALKTNM